MKHWRYWRMFRWTWSRNDPRRYGAIPDGKTDCTAAIQRCIDVGGGVRMASGTYLINSTAHGPKASSSNTFTGGRISNQ